MATFSIPPLAEFRAWLEPRRNEIVGFAGQTNGCPIARWLTDVHKRPFKVSCVLGIFDCHGQRTKAARAGLVNPVIPPRDWPQWLGDFVTAVDTMSPDDAPECDGAWCLSLLDEAAGGSHPLAGR